jgi:hypothetical protein
MGRAKSDERYTEQEAQRRTEAALRAAFSTPHKTYEESKLGKPRGKRPVSPNERREKND